MEGQTIGTFSIGAHLPGAQQFKLSLVFWNGRVTGQGHVTQAINPPLDVETFLSGTSREIVWGADVQQVISLIGHEFRTQTPPNPGNVDCTILLDNKNPAKDVASLSYLDAHGKWIELRNQPVKVRWIRSPD